MAIFKSILVIVLTGISFNAIGQSNDRIDLLEKEIQELKLRLNRLESVNKDENLGPQLSNSSDGWKSIAYWRKLETGMNTAVVRKILGEPHRVEGGEFAFWTYQNGGRVTFLNGSLHQWSEPRK